MMIDITKDPIAIDKVLENVTDPAAGAIDLFLGTARNNTGGRAVLSLEYEAHVPMALKLMNEIVRQAHSRWNICRASVVHRVGLVPITEASIAVAVSSPHRKEAFEACRFILDAVKADVPIWKREMYEDGHLWVGSQVT